MFAIKKNNIAKVVGVVVMGGQTMNQLSGHVTQNLTPYTCHGCNI